MSEPSVYFNWLTPILRMVLQTINEKTMTTHFNPFWFIKSESLYAKIRRKNIISFIK